MERKEAIEIVRKLYNESLFMKKDKEAMVTLIPELKESEDERIRKAILELVKQSSHILNPMNQKSMIAWLENQGEQKPADKVEPKFKVGDWVVSPNGVYWHIDKISNSRYEVTCNTGENSNWQLDTNIYHRFTIQDAKDGDVLCCNDGWICIFKSLINSETFSSYCFMDKYGLFFDSGSECHTLKSVKAYNGELYPATKEQRDFLFQKMKKAGYEWDAEKKELNEIEQKPTERSLPYEKNETAEKLIALAECLEMDGDCLFNGLSGYDYGMLLRVLAIDMKSM